MLLTGSPPTLGHSRRFAGLTGAADALALAQYVQTQRPILVLTASALDAQRLRDEILCLMKRKFVHWKKSEK